jgi:acetyl esterase
VWDENLSVERARRLTREEAAVAAGTRKVPVGGVRELTVEQMPARLYTSAEPGPRTLLLYLHGGGFVVGDLDTHDAPCRVLCRHAGVDVLSVEYRKAPEHPFPAYVDDARAAYAWAAGHFERVAVGGDSAGGNLAATLAIECDPVLALLIYPAVDATQVRRSRELFGKGFFLTDELMQWYTGHFLPEGADGADPLRSPLFSPDLPRSAPALVVTAGFDPLRDEGEAYAEALRAAGVPVLARRFPGLFHGFINSIGASPSSHDALVEVAGMTRALLR